MFDRLADIVVKHHKLVIITWVIILVISIPAILGANSVINYSQTGGTGGTTESQQAQNIISSEFPQSVANGTLIVVIQSDNMTNAATRNFVLQLQDQIATSNNVQDLQNITTIYTVYSSALNATILAIGPNMRPMENATTFGALFIWGIPDNYTKNWIESGSGSNETAYNGTAAYINSLQLNDTDNALALNYLGEFNDAWNSTPVDINNPFITASTAVNKTVPALIPSYPAWAQQILLPSFKYFSITNYSNPALIHTVSIGLIGQAASITNTTFLQRRL